MLDQIAVPQDKIADFCRRWKIPEFSVFGSVLRDDFSPESDIDVLVTFKPGVKYGFADFADMESELQAIFGRRVDIGTRRSVEGDPNYLRRRTILNSAKMIYADLETVQNDIGDLIKQLTPLIPSDAIKRLPVSANRRLRAL